MKKLFWRMLAVILFLVWTVVFITNNYLGFLESKSEHEILITNIFFAVPFLFFGLLIFFPTKYELYAVVCCYLGLEGLVEGGELASMLMYCLGCGFVYRSGHLFKNKLISILLCVLPIIALLTQVRFGVVLLLANFLNLLFICAFFVLSYAILKETVWQNTNPFKQSLSNKKRDLSELTAEEVDIVRAVFDNRTFYSIGLDRNKSESAIKQSMVSIYKKLNVENKKELLDLQNSDLLIFPE